jgi:GEVED domain/Fibronectin type III domain
MISNKICLHSFRICFLVIFLFVLPKELKAQVSFSQNFNTAPVVWTGSMMHSTLNSGCGSPNMLFNLWLFAPACDLITPLTGTSIGGVVTLSYDYKVAIFSANTVGAPNPWGSFNVQYGPTANGPWVTIETINSSNHVVSGSCATRTVTFNPPAGALYVKWDVLWDNGDNYFNIDNVAISEVSGTACSGTPVPGNTISSVSSTCPNTLFNLSLQNTTPGTGLSYIWQSASNAAFTANVQTLSSTIDVQSITNQTSATYYRCQVTCGANSAYSNPVLVNQSPGTSCYCIPNYTSGKTSGDLISNIVIGGTTLSNFTGMLPVNPFYQFFTGSPNLTASLQAGSSYNVTVSNGNFGNQYVAAWIDYNDDGFFTVSERIGYTTAPLAANSSVNFPIVLACNPPLGVHRLRIRDVFNTPGASIDPCASYSFGETEDYNITITAAAFCPAPTALMVSNPTANSVVLTWTVGCSETAWTVEYGPSGFTPGTGTSVAATTNPFTVNGLNCGMNYHFYVYANCSLTGISAPSGVVAISTLLCPCTGSPNPGNTISSGLVCSAGGSVNLSLQNSMLFSGFTYQWQRANDPSFTSNLQNLGTNPTQVGIVNGPTYFRCMVTCSNSSLSTFSTPLLADITLPPSIGNTMANPFFIGHAPCATYTYTNTVHNGDCYTNNMSGSQPSPDIYYQFTLTSLTTIQASLCGSSIDTYMHLLDHTGALISTNNDNGPLCAGVQSSISSLLGAGTYFIVVEGAGSLTGNLVFSLNTLGACQAVMNINAFVEGYYVSGSSPSIMTPARYTNLVSAGSPSPGDPTDVTLVNVELWPNAGGPAYTTSGMLSTNGNLSVTFPTAAIGNTYWISVTTPNTLRIFSASSVTITGNNVYIFSNAMTQAFTDGSSPPMITLASGLFGLKSGDINQDDFVDGTDYSVFEADVFISGGGVFSLTSDLNGDAFVDGTDYPILDFNSTQGYSTQYPTFL